MKATSMVTIVAALFALAGCFPEEKITWSPDGQTAALVTADGLRLCDAQGKLSKEPVAGVGAAAWFPDSRRIVVVRTVPAEKWEDLAQWIDEPQRKQIIENADRVSKALLDYPGKELGKAFETIKGDFLGSQGGAILLYLCKQGDAELARKYGDEWAKTKKTPVNYYCLTVYEVAGLEAKAAGGDLARALTNMRTPGVASTGSVVTVVGASENNRPALCVFGVVNRGGGVVAEGVGQYSWTADGKTLVYLRANGKESEGKMQLGTLTTRAVADEKGLLAKMGDPVDVCGLLFDEQIKVRSLRDGTILFAGLDARLPSAAKDMPTKPSLFSVKPGGDKVVRVLEPALVEKMTTALNWFVVSPDETLLAAPGITGKVEVVTLPGGAIVAVQPFEKEGARVNVLPVWRSAKELCIVTPPGAPLGSPKRTEVVMLTLAPDGTVSQSTILSKGWPDEAVASFVTESSATSQPATQPAEKTETK